MHWLLRKIERGGGWRREGTRGRKKQERTLSLVLLFPAFHYHFHLDHLHFICYFAWMQTTFPSLGWSLEGILPWPMHGSSQCITCVCLYYAPFSVMSIVLSPSLSHKSVYFSFILFLSSFLALPIPYSLLSSSQRGTVMDPIQSYLCMHYHGLIDSHVKFMDWRPWVLNHSYWGTYNA